jgi:hypothetical protein
VALERQRSTTAFGALMERLIAACAAHGWDAHETALSFEIVVGEFFEYAKNPWRCTFTASEMVLESSAPTGAEALLKIVEGLEK